MADDLLEQLAARNRHRAELAQRKVDSDAEAVLRREQGFDLCFSGANTDRINDKLQQPQTRRRRVQSANVSRQSAESGPSGGGGPPAARRGWQQAPISLIADDGRQVQLRPQWALAEHSDAEEEEGEEEDREETEEVGGAEGAGGVEARPRVDDEDPFEDAFDAYERGRIEAKRLVTERSQRREAGDGVGDVWTSRLAAASGLDTSRWDTSRLNESLAEPAESAHGALVKRRQQRAAVAAAAAAAPAVEDARRPREGDTSSGGRAFEERLARAQRNGAAVAARRQTALAEQQLAGGHLRPETRDLGLQPAMAVTEVVEEEEVEESGGEEEEEVAEEEFDSDTDGEEMANEMAEDISEILEGEEIAEISEEGEAEMSEEEEEEETAAVRVLGWGMGAV